MSKIQQIDIKINELETAKTSIHSLFMQLRSPEGCGKYHTGNGKIRLSVQQELRQLYQQKGQLHQRNG